MSDKSIIEQSYLKAREFVAGQSHVKRSVELDAKVALAAQLQQNEGANVHQPDAGRILSKTQN
jgi:hypothetical protein